MILGKNFDYLFLEILLQLDEITFYYYFPKLIAKLWQNKNNIFAPIWQFVGIMSSY